MTKFKMIKAGEETTITKEQATEIMGQDEFDFQQNEASGSWVQDDVEIFLSRNI